MARFEDIEVWKRSARLSVSLYKELAELKDFGFRDQITRAALSVPSNIAEGYERNSNKELANFLNYAKGSAGEIRTRIYIGMEIGYINKDAGKIMDKRMRRNIQNASRIHSNCSCSYQITGARNKMQGTC
ncbi:MAG: four helix bundle protein [Sideroxydans sp.]|nr:four helix bundle protein [Sideroxydans sp.]